MQTIIQYLNTIGAKGTSLAPMIGTTRSASVSEVLNGKQDEATSYKILFRIMLALCQEYPQTLKGWTISSDGINLEARRFVREGRTWGITVEGRRVELTDNLLNDYETLQKDLEDQDRFLNGEEIKPMSEEEQAKEALIRSIVGFEYEVIEERLHIDSIARFKEFCEYLDSIPEYHEYPKPEPPKEPEMPQPLTYKYQGLEITAEEAEAIFEKQSKQKD